MKNDYGKTIKLDIYKTYFAKDKIATLEKIKKWSIVLTRRASRGKVALNFFFLYDLAWVIILSFNT